ncbi:MULTISPECIES: helix-turn-helix domain-containing protein [unclassified Streptomyces]|uniref:helix-turn-helix domain-containing protein n=1 Tax=unclassified Streptomyces TaxID=2593676 RepID=UPI0038185112
MTPEQAKEGLAHEGPGGYSMTPKWVIKAAFKHVWLYDWLRARYGGLDETFPGVDTLAKEFGVSRSTIERTMRELRKVGALEVHPRFRNSDGTIVTLRDGEAYTGNGAQTTNLYVTKFYPPAASD